MPKEISVRDDENTNLAGEVRNVTRMFEIFLDGSCGKRGGSEEAMMSPEAGVAAGLMVLLRTVL